MMVQKMGGIAPMATPAMPMGLSRNQQTASVSASSSSANGPSRLHNGRPMQEAKPNMNPNAEMVDHFGAVTKGAIIGAIGALGHQIFLGGTNPFTAIRHSLGFATKSDDLVTVHQHWGQDHHLYRYTMGQDKTREWVSKVYRTPKKGMLAEISKNFRPHAEIIYHDAPGLFDGDKPNKPSQHYTVRIFEENGTSLHKVVHVEPEQTLVEHYHGERPRRETFKPLEKQSGYVLTKVEHLQHKNWQVSQAFEPVWHNGKLMVQEVLHHETPFLGLLGAQAKGNLKPATLLDHLTHITPRVPVGARQLRLKNTAILERVLNLRGLWMGAAAMAIAVWFAEVINSTNTSTKVNLNFNGMAGMPGVIPGGISA